MGKSLVDALSENAWSVSAVMFDLNDILDDEGRPISERRADAAARVGVEMEMRQCPFSDIRKDKWMNVSALEQISRYYTDVLAEMSALRRQVAGAQASWDDILVCVIDLLAGPAIHLLRHRQPQGAVPAQVAVGHKLAAGMFGVMTGLHERLALGSDLPVSTDNFLKLVEELGALVGTSEACAGSPPMIRKASEALMEGNVANAIEIDPVRLDIARCLALQAQLGIFWSLYDQAHFWSLIRGEFREHLEPCNGFLERKLKQAEIDLAQASLARPDSTRLPQALDGEARQRIAEALNDAAGPDTLEEDVRASLELLALPGAAIGYRGAPEPLAHRIASYLNTFRLFEAELTRLEQQLRGHLGYPADTPVRLGSAVFAIPGALHWYEFILGRKHGADGHLTGASTRARMASSAG